MTSVWDVKHFLALRAYSNALIFSITRAEKLVRFNRRKPFSFRPTLLLLKRIFRLPFLYNRHRII